MLFVNFVPEMREQDAEASGEYDVLLLQPPPQEEGMPTTEPEDADMSDQPPTEVQKQVQPLDDMADLQLITKNEFERKPGRKLVRGLRTAPKRLEKTIGKQKTNIESLEVKVDVLDGQLGDANRYQQNCERELKDTQAQLATTKKALQASKGCWARQNGTVQRLRADLQQSKDAARSVAATNSDLQGKLVASQEALTKCRDDLFRLQPMAEVADSSIVKELEIVSQEVVHWIEAEVAAFEKAHPEAGPEDIFSVGKNKGVATFLQHHPAAGEHLARYLIHRFFRANLFGRRFYLLGLTEGIAQLLQKAEHSMAKLDPPRGTSDLKKEVSATAADNRQILLVSQHGVRRHCRLLLPLTNANRSGHNNYKR